MLRQYKRTHSDASNWFSFAFLLISIQHKKKISVFCFNIVTLTYMHIVHMRSHAYKCECEHSIHTMIMSICVCVVVHKIRPPLKLYIYFAQQNRNIMWSELYILQNINPNRRSISIKYTHLYIERETVGESYLGWTEAVVYKCVFHLFIFFFSVKRLSSDGLQRNILTKYIR